MVYLPPSQKLPPENLKVMALNAVTVILRYPEVIHSNQDSDKGHWYHSSMVAITEMLVRQLVFC